MTNARVNVMSILSPGLTPSMFFLSSTIRVTVRPSAVVTVIEGTAGSTALTVTVALSWTATVPAGSFVFARSNAASKWCSFLQIGLAALHLGDEVVDFLVTSFIVPGVEALALLLEVSNLGLYDVQGNLLLYHRVGVAFQKLAVFRDLVLRAYDAVVVENDDGIAVKVDFRLLACVS